MLIDTHNYSSLRCDNKLMRNASNTIVEIVLSYVSAQPYTKNNIINDDHLEKN